MALTSSATWGWLDDRFGRPFLGSPSARTTGQTIVLNGVAAVLLALAALLGPLLLLSLVRGGEANPPCGADRLWVEGASVVTESRWFPPGVRCTFTSPDGDKTVVEPGPATSVVAGAVGLAWSSLVGIGLLAPPTRLWRRLAWIGVSGAAPVLLALVSGYLPSPADGILFVFAICVGFGLVFAVLTAAISYGIHPGEWWWLFPGAWLGWSLAFTTLALVIWVLAS